MSARHSAPRVVGAALCALLLLSCAHGRSGPEGPPDYLGALNLPAAGPVPHSPQALSGRVVVATFFATWCFPCLAQLSYFAQLQRELAEQGLSVVAVGMDLEGARVLRPFAEQQQVPYPVLAADERLRKGETPFGPISVLPSTVILDREGQVVAAWPGLANAEEVRAAIDQALK